MLLSYRVLYKDANGVARGPDQSGDYSLTLPCSCDIANNLSGAPSNVQLYQEIGNGDLLWLQFTPSSLCTSVYRINLITANLTGPDINTYYAESDRYCSLILPVNTSIVSVSWEMTGRVQKMRL